MTADTTLEITLRSIHTVDWTVCYASKRHSGTMTIDGDLGKLYASTLAVVQEHGIDHVVLDAPELGLEQTRAVIMLIALKHKIHCRVISRRTTVKRPSSGRANRGA